MKLQIVSDLHLEFQEDNEALVAFLKGLKTDADVLVAAGDIATHKAMEVAIKTMCEIWPEVIYICGNHEFYDSNFGKIFNILERMENKYTNFHWLNDKAVEIKGQRFLGNTMWFQENELTTNPYLQKQLNDFYWIENFRDHVFKYHNRTVVFLRENIRPGDIVVTHHAPSEKSEHPKHKSDNFNCFYQTDLEDMIKEKKPALWLHGHTHSSHNYKIDETQIICNPHGYIGHEVNPTFNPQLVIEV